MLNASERTCFHDKPDAHVPLTKWSPVWKQWTEMWNMRWRLRFGTLSIFLTLLLLYHRKRIKGKLKHRPKFHQFAKEAPRVELDLMDPPAAFMFSLFSVGKRGRGWIMWVFPWKLISYRFQWPVLFAEKSVASANWNPDQDDRPLLVATSDNPHCEQWRGDLSWDWLRLSEKPRCNKRHENIWGIGSFLCTCEQ